MRLTDFNRGLSYGLVVALACSLGAYWLGQDHGPPARAVSAQWIPSCETDLEHGVNAIEITGEIVIERNDAAGCVLTVDGWACITEIVTEGR